ncbi:hypothetical protein AMTRI_Chr03g140030 [Amborella trichopoda]
MQQDLCREELATGGRNHLDDAEQNVIVVAGFTELGSKLISKFVSESQIQYCRIYRTFKSYSNECYRLALHTNATYNAYYHASLPGIIPKLVLETLSMKI